MGQTGGQQRHEDHDKPTNGQENAHAGLGEAAAHLSAALASIASWLSALPNVHSYENVWNPVRQCVMYP